LKFLKEIDAQVPEGLDVHIVMDNYATHKTPKINAWLARRPHYHIHFTPTTGTTKTQSPSNGPSPLTRFWLQSNTSVTGLSKLYVANFSFT
jgi:hypothetical protein